MLQASSDRSGKQQQQQNSPNLVEAAEGCKGAAAVEQQGKREPSFPSPRSSYRNPHLNKKPYSVRILCVHVLCRFSPSPIATHSGCENPTILIPALKLVPLRENDRNLVVTLTGLQRFRERHGQRCLRVAAGPCRPHWPNHAT